MCPRAEQVLEVLLLCVDQREGVCGKGHGTRLVNAAKALLVQQARLLGAARAVLLTQSDVGLQARLFWTRQRLRACGEAGALVRALHAWHASHVVYDHTVAMSAQAATTASKR